MEDHEIRLACVEHARHMMSSGATGSLGNDALAVAKTLYDWVNEANKQAIRHQVWPLDPVNQTQEPQPPPPHVKPRPHK